MTWQTIFELTNLVAVIAWGLLFAAPRKSLVMSAVLYLGVGLLCFSYFAMMAALLAGVVDPVRASGTETAFHYDVAGIKALLSSDGGVTLAWTHFLAFDLFVGLWIARDADAKRFSRLVQVPVLLLTFFVGPVGLLAWLVVRERRARLTQPR